MGHTQLIRTTPMLVLAGVAQPALALVPQAEFYLVKQECSTTVASLRRDRKLATEVHTAEPPEIRRCAIAAGKALCHSQMDIGGHLVDHPVHHPDEYHVVSDDGSVLQLSGENGAWMTLNMKSRTAVTSIIGNSPAERDPGSIDAVAFMVCRGALVTAGELRQLGKRK